MVSSPAPVPSSPISTRLPSPPFDRSTSRRTRHPDEQLGAQGGHAASKKLGGPSAEPPVALSSALHASPAPLPLDPELTPSRPPQGNGAKAQQKRERNAKDAKKGPTSQKAVCVPPPPCARIARADSSPHSPCAHSNAAQMNIICTICRQAFFVTTKVRSVLSSSPSRQPR